MRDDDLLKGALGLSLIIALAMWVFDGDMSLFKFYMIFCANAIGLKLYDNS